MWAICCNRLAAMKKHFGIEVPRRSDVVSRHKFRKARIVTQNIGILLPQKRKIGGLNHLNPQRRLIVDRAVHRAHGPDRNPAADLRIAGTGFRGPRNIENP